MTKQRTERLKTWISIISTTIAAVAVTLSITGLPSCSDLVTDAQAAAVHKTLMDKDAAQDKKIDRTAQLLNEVAKLVERLDERTKGDK